MSYDEKPQWVSEQNEAIREMSHRSSESQYLDRIRELEKENTELKKENADLKQRLKDFDSFQDAEKSMS